MIFKNVLLKTVLLYCFIIYDADFYTTSKNYCTLPDGNTATCTLLEECKPIVEYINFTKPYSPDVKNLLNDYSCAFNRWKETTHVCCPPGPPVVNNHSEDAIPSPPDVTSHKNLNLLPKDCGIIDIGDKIRNGINASLNEFPWMALLSYNTSTGPNFKCGATVINDRYILTAAHCVVGVKYQLLGVRVGEYNLGSEIDCEDDFCLPPVQDLAIEKVIYPEDYNATLYANDIALLRVTKINLDEENVKPICLPTKENLRNLPIEKGVVTGWGFLDPYETTTNILQRVVLAKRDMSICKKYYRIEPAIRISFKQLCIGGEEKKDSCGGDSGGPFQVAAHFDGEARYVQYGIVSAGPSFCGYEGAPALYTKIPYYMDWILDNLEP